MVNFLKTFQISDGVTAAEATPGAEALYLQPEEALGIFGCQLSAETARFVNALIDSYCNRTSLYPVVWESGPIRVPSDRQEVRLPVLPVIKILEAAGRYGLQRRDRQGWNSFAYGLSPILALNAAARPQWTSISVDAIELSPAEGLVFLPFSSLLLPYSYVRLKVLSGLVDIPHRIKAAVVEIANAISQKGVSDRQKYTVGRVSRQFASDSFITPLARQLLQPFVVSEYA